LGGECVSGESSNIMNPRGGSKKDPLVSQAGRPTKRTTGMPSRKKVKFVEEGHAHLEISN